MFSSSPIGETVRTLPRAMWILLAGNFLNRFGTFVMPFLVLYLTANGYSEAQAGIALSAYGAGHLVASLLGGYLADALGRRQTIILSMLSSAATMLFLSQARSMAALVPLTLLAGLCTELYRPASSALAADICSPEQRLVGSALYRLAVNLGFAAGPITAGFLAHRSFFLLFIGDAATSILFALITIFALPQDVRHLPPTVSEQHWLAAAVSDRPFLRFLVASLASTAVVMQMDSTLALHVQREGFSTATFGALVSINGVLIVLFEVALTTWTVRLRPRAAMAGGYLLCGLGFALTGVAHSRTALAATIVVWTLGEMISSPVAGAHVANLAPAHLRGRYMGLWSATWSLAMVIGPSVGTLLFAANEPLLWGTCGLLGIFSALIVLL